MIHVRCAEQMSAMLLFQTMPALRANLCADGPTGVRRPASAPASRSLARRVEGYRAIEAVAPNCKGSRGSHQKQSPRSPERYRRVEHPMRPNFTAFRTGGEQTLRAC